MPVATAERRGEKVPAEIADAPMARPRAAHTPAELAALCHEIERRLSHTSL